MCDHAVVGTASQLALFWSQVYKVGYTEYPQLFGVMKRKEIQSLNLFSEDAHLLLVMKKKIEERGISIRDAFLQLDPDGKGTIEVRRCSHDAVFTSAPPPPPHPEPRQEGC